MQTPGMIRARLPALLLALGLLGLPSVAWAHGGWQGIFITFGLAALPVVLVLLLIQGLSLWLARRPTPRKVWGFLTLILGILSLLWLLVMVGIDISANGWRLLRELKEATAMTALTLILHLLSLGLAVRLIRHQPQPEGPPP